MLTDLSAAKGLTQILIDVREVQAYETSFREAWVTYLKANTAVRVDILVQSALQKMGISLANMVLSNKVIGHTNPALFASLKEKKP